MDEPAPHSQRDWPEDFAHENGEYRCLCAICNEIFYGHKRRVVCKSCHEARKRGE